MIALLYLAQVNMDGVFYRWVVRRGEAACSLFGEKGSSFCTSCLFGDRSAFDLPGT